MGVREEDGKRMLLGVSVSLSEAEVHWRAFLEGLRKRGLEVTKLITSDDHAGLRAARRAVFPNLPWQRCQFHLQQNAQHYMPSVALRPRALDEQFDSGLCVGDNEIYDNSGLSGRANGKQTIRTLMQVRIVSDLSRDHTSGGGPTER